MPSLPQSRQEDRPRMDPGQPDESREPKRRHEGDGAVGNPPEQGITRAQMTDQKPGEQRADAGAQRNFDASDRKGHENANDAAEENRESQHDEIDRRAREQRWRRCVAAAFCTTGSGPTMRSKSPRCSTTPAAIGISWPPRLTDRKYRPRVQSSLDASARVLPASFGLDEQDIGGRDRNVEEFLVLDLLGARSDQLDDDLARAGERDHVARLGASCRALLRGCVLLGEAGG